MNTNNLYLVMAMSRSGHHAIIDWIYEQFLSEKFFFNYCDFSQPDPLFSHRVQYYYNNQKYYSKISNSWIQYNLIEQKLKEFTKEPPKISKNIASSGKNLLLMNFENLDTANLPMTIDEYAKHFGEIQNVVPILIIRDIFNLIASRIKSGRELTMEDISENSSRLTETLEIWKNHAREYVGETNNLPTKIIINYNEWFTSKAYKKDLSKKLKVDMAITEWDTIATFGGGSSFDNKNVSAPHIKVLERWEEYKDNKDFKNLFLKNPEIVSLSEQIFGKIHDF